MDPSLPIYRLVNLHSGYRALEERITVSLKTYRGNAALLRPEIAACIDFLSYADAVRTSSALP